MMARHADTLALAPSTTDTSVVDVRLTPIARRLYPVVVLAGRAKYNGRLAGYYQRLERRSSGYFITREDMKRNGTPVIDITKVGVRAFGRWTAAPGGRNRP